jgi:tetratricopeptide (TPR) repeat protein
VRWNGPTHEVLEGQQTGSSDELAGVRFRELPKDAAALKHKFERDVAILKKYTRQHAKQPRWFYYLGASHQDLGEYAAAIDAYRTCAELGGWAEEGAWACYRAAECCCKLHRYGEAIHLCAAGLALRPATAELAWLAGFAAYKLGRHEDAIAWSHMAIANGLYEGRGAGFPRISFRYPTALYEGPYDVLRWAHKALGHAAESADAEQKFERAKQARDAASASGT